MVGIISINTLLIVVWVAAIGVNSAWNRRFG
jgi:hypothetical protein